jgi:polyhydroxyalkanoate synthesis regulator phasin
MSDEQTRRGSASSGIGEGIRSGIGILTAFKDALEETIQEAMSRGDLSPERARQAVNETVSRMQHGFDEARERLDFVPRKEYDTLLSQVIDLRARVEALERRSYPAGDDNGIVFEAD